MTLRLLLLALDHWTVLDGWAAARGLDIEDLPLGRGANLIYWWATRGAGSEAEVAKFRAALWRPPAGVVPDRGPWSPAGENAAFAGLKAVLGK